MERARSKLQEELVSLYLRLNGFFVTGFIVHSPIHGNNRTELDALAVRHKFNADPERQFGPDPLLDLSQKYIDLALCEVKSRGQLLQFNAALYGNSDSLISVLRWSGLFDEFEARKLVQKLATALQPNNCVDLAPPTVFGPRNVRIRGLLFSPERNSKRPNQPWFVTGPEMFEYMFGCLCPERQRITCATIYDFSLWGRFEPIVRYFKTRQTLDPGNLNDLYEFVENNKT